MQAVTDPWTTMAADLEALSLQDLRRRRDAVREEEESLSYRRRVLHAQLDLVQASASVGDADDVQSLLAQVLSDEPRPGAGGEVRAVHVDVAPADDLLSNLPTDLTALGDAERDQLMERLRRDEHEISHRRRELLDQLDALQAEIVRRYRRDGVDARALLGGTD